MLVYFAQAEVADRLIKIGATNRLQQRLAALRSGCPCELTVLGVVEHPRGEALVERLRGRFAAHRAHHDWFRPADNLLTYIREHARPASSVVGAAAPVEVVDALTASLAPLVTLREAARLLAVSEATIRRRVQDQDIEYVRVGRQLRFSPHALR